MLNDYLNDEEQGAAGGRNPISSINEVLREGKFSRDRIKVCCGALTNNYENLVVSSLSASVPIR